MASSLRGHFMWHELCTTDIRLASTFYKRVAGWTTQSWEQDQSYVMWMAGKTAMGGLLKDDARRWLPYVGTDDVEVAVWEAQRLGGKVISDTETVPTVGKFATLQDPMGAAFAVIQPASDARPKYPVAIGDFSWHELVTSNVEEAFRFYSALFGWEKNSVTDMGPPVGSYLQYGWKGRDIGGIYRKTAEDPGPHRWVSYIKVRDTKAAIAGAKESGGQILLGPMEVPGGDTIAVGRDAQGIEFAVHSVKAKKPAKKKAKAAKKPTKKKRTGRR